MTTTLAPNMLERIKRIEGDSGDSSDPAAADGIAESAA